MAGRYFAYIVIFISIFFISDTYSQTLWGIEVGDKKQYSTWEDADGSKVNKDVEFWGTAKFKDGVLEMDMPEGKDADFQSAFIELVVNYSQPNFFNDRNIKLEKEKKREDSIKAVVDSLKRINRNYKPPRDTTVIPEDTRNVDQMVADGDMIMRRTWILVDYEMELTFDQYGLRYKLKYLN
jgi:hypothetical protein